MQPAVDPFQVVNTFTARAKPSSGGTAEGNSHHHQQQQVQHQQYSGYNYYNGPSSVVNSSHTIPLMQALDGDMDGLDESGASKYAKGRGLRHRWNRLPRSVKRVVLGLLACLVIYFLLSLMFGSGGQGSEGQSGHAGADDAMFDPHANPNIRIQSRD